MTMSDRPTLSHDEHQAILDDTVILASVLRKVLRGSYDDYGDFQLDDDGFRFVDTANISLTPEEVAAVKRALPDKET